MNRIIKLKAFFPLAMARTAFFALCIICCSCGSSAKPVFLLITIDTLRADHLGCYGYPRETTPFIDELAKKGTLFKSAFTPMPITCASHASILTSLHPVTHQLLTNGNDKLRDEVETIAEVFSKNGFYTIGTVAATFLSSSFGFHQGFDNFSDENGDWTRDALKINRQLFSQIDDYLKDPGKREKPLFIWLHYYDVHAPYLPHQYTFSKPVPARFNLSSKANHALMANIENYDQEIRFVDDAIREVYRYLQEKKMLGQLTACITSDHGEQHMEHGFYHQHCDFYSETTHVPLIFTGKGVPDNKTVAYPVSSMDITQTLLDYAGLKLPYKPDGYNLFNAPRKDREFLIAGHPYYHYSLQLLRYPWVYIRNHDKYYSHWYKTEKELFPANSLLAAKPEQVTIKKGKKNHLTFYFPDARQEGLIYAAASLRIDIPKQSRAALWVTFNQRLQNHCQLPPRSGVITIAQPVTPLSRYQVKLEIFSDPDVRISDIRYAFLTPELFAPLAQQFTIQTAPMFHSLKTKRKFKAGDEVFNLDSDPGMFINLLDNTGVLPSSFNAPDFQRSIQRWFSLYYEKGRKQFGGRVPGKMQGRRQIELLKSLGYL